MSRAWTWRHAIIKSKLPATTKHVLLVVSCHMNEVGEGCYPSTKTLAERCSLSERSVCTHLEEAEKAGWLTVKRHGFGGQNWARNEYEPAWPKATEPDAEVEKGTEPDDAKALKQVPEGTEPDAAYIDNSPSTRPTTSPTPKAPKGAEAVNGAFEDFWKAYPNKVGKPVALRAFLKAKPAPETLSEGLARWLASEDWQKDNGRYIPHPSTFLNQRRWEDIPRSMAKPKTELDRRNDEFWDTFVGQPSSNQKQIA